MGVASVSPDEKPSAVRPEFPSKGFVQGFRKFAKLAKAAVLLLVLKGVADGLVWLYQGYRSGDLKQLVDAAVNQRTEIRLIPVCVGAAALLVFGVWWATARRPVYMVDFTVYKAPDHLKLTKERFYQGSRDCGAFSEEALAFQDRIAMKSGLEWGKTALPPALWVDPPDISMSNARDEAEMVMYPVVEAALKKTGLKPTDIDILIVNCSLFCPTPSLSAMIVNHFRMRPDILSYNLGGMGCSAGVIAIGLAEKMLQVEPSGYALVVSTENITQNWYPGNNRSMLIPNTLFRMGAAAIVLTNKRSARWTAKYQLQKVYRVHLGADNNAFRCVYQHADDKGIIGVELNKQLVQVAGKSLQVNMTRMGRSVLPVSEQILFALNWLWRHCVNRAVKPYVPDFRQAFDHFCLHAGGRGVVEGIGKQLRLSREQKAPSANTLANFGNTSSSTIWYSLSFIETCQHIRRGDTVWQVGFGSGFKCNSAIWKALRPVKDVHPAWAHQANGGRKDPDFLVNCPEDEEN